MAAKYHISASQLQAFVINRGRKDTTASFQLFIDDACRAFNLLRQNASTLLNTMRLMCSSDIPQLDNEALQFVQSNLELHLDELSATVLLTRMIEECSASWAPRLNFLAHTIAQYATQAGRATSGRLDFDHMSFNSGDYTQESDGRIESVLVRSARKTRGSDGRKIYVSIKKRRLYAALILICSFTSASFNGAT